MLSENATKLKSNLTYFFDNYNPTTNDVKFFIIVPGLSEKNQQ